MTRTPSVSRARAWLSLAAVAATLLVGAPSAPASSALDPTFGSGGKVTTNLGATSGVDWHDHAYAVALQPDGKLVVAGAVERGSATDFALVRYRSDGTPDPTFGSNGSVVTDVDGYDVANAVQVLADGKILVGGIAGSGFGLARYHASGTLDTSFGTNGTVTTSFGGGVASGHAMAVTPGGAIVLAGVLDSTNNASFAIARYTSSGALDTTFATDGKVTTSFSGKRAAIYAIALHDDGKVVVAGSAEDDLDADFALARYTPSGALDPTFGSSGTVTTDLAGDYDYAYAMLVQPDGRIVAGGLAGTQYGSEFGLVRYSNDGTPDASFGSGGMVRTNFDAAFGGDTAFAQIGGIAMLGGGIVAAGTAGISGTRFALARYTSSGALDPSFGGSGTTTTSFGGVADEANAIAIEPDGKIIAAGHAYGSSSFDLALARYEGDAIPPSEPRNLTATSAGQPAGAIALSWEAPLRSPPGPVLGYRIYRGTTSQSLAPVTTIGAVTSFTDTGLPDDTRYVYRVAAINKIGEGARSNEAAATTRGRPTEPRALGATPGDRRITLAWQAPADPGTQPITGYRIERGTTASNLTHLATVGVVSSYTDASLGVADTRTYRVAAVNGLGVGPWSSVVTATTWGPPGAPRDSAATGGTNRITITWRAPADDGGVPITNYDIAAGPTPTSTTHLTHVGVTTTFVHTGLADNVTRCYVLRAVNSYGPGAPSTAACATTRGLPTEPLNVLASSGVRAVTLTWDPPADVGTRPITAYRIYRGSSPGAESLLAQTGPGRTYTDDTLGNGARVWYRISAVNALGEGPASASMAGVTFGVPDVPRSVSAVPGTSIGEVVVTWREPSNDGGTPVMAYLIYRTDQDGNNGLIGVVFDARRYVDRSATPGLRYEYRVAAANAAGEGPASAPACTRPFPWLAPLPCLV